VRDPRELVQAARDWLAKTPGVQVEYVEAVDARTLQPLEQIEGPVVVAIAARLGPTRLIDNMVFTP
jgi:pantothenate synthetase